MLWIIEAYKQKKDFEAHQQTSHFKEWHPHFKRMIEEFIPNTDVHKNSTIASNYYRKS